MNQHMKRSGRSRLAWHGRLAIALGAFACFSASPGYSFPLSPTGNLANARGQFRREMLEGRQRLRDRDYRGALISFERAARADPTSPEARRSLQFARFELAYQSGLTNSSRHHWARAQADFAQALTIASGAGLTRESNLANTQLLLVQGERWMQAGAYSAAAKSFARALAVSPRNPQAQAALITARYMAALVAGRAALARGSLEVAAKYFREGLEYRPGDPEVRLQLTRLNQMEAVTKEFNRNLKKANASLNAGRWNRARVALHGLARALDRAQRAGLRSPALFHSRPLMPAYLNYAWGDWSAAFGLAQTARNPQDEARAAAFRRFLLVEEQKAELRKYAWVLMVGYGLSLLLSLYAGLAKALRRETASLESTSPALSP